MTDLDVWSSVLINAFRIADVCWMHCAAITVYCMYTVVRENIGVEIFFVASAIYEI